MQNPKQTQPQQAPTHVRLAPLPTKRRTGSIRPGVLNIVILGCLVSSLGCEVSPEIRSKLDAQVKADYENNTTRANATKERIAALSAASANASIVDCSADSGIFKRDRKSLCGKRVKIVAWVSQIQELIVPTATATYSASTSEYHASYGTPTSPGIANLQLEPVDQDHDRNPRTDFNGELFDLDYSQFNLNPAVYKTIGCTRGTATVYLYPEPRVEANGSITTAYLGLVTDLSIEPELTPSQDAAQQVANEVKAADELPANKPILRMQSLTSVQQVLPTIRGRLVTFHAKVFWIKGARTDNPALHLGLPGIDSVPKAKAVHTEHGVEVVLEGEEFDLDPKITRSNEQFYDDLHNQMATVKLFIYPKDRTAYETESKVKRRGVVISIDVD